LVTRAVRQGFTRCCSTAAPPTIAYAATEASIARAFNASRDRLVMRTELRRRVEKT